MTVFLLAAGLLAAGPNPRELPAAGAHGRAVTDLAFTADGRGLVSVDGDGQVVRWDLATGRPTPAARLGPFPDHAYPQFEVARGGRRVAVGTAAAPARVLDPATRAVLATVPRRVLDADEWTPAFSADGSRVAFGFYRGHGSPVPGPAPVPVWDVAADRPAGTVELPIPPGGIVTVRVALSADGSRLAAAITPAPANRGSGTELGVWDVATGRRLGTRVLPGDPAAGVTFLPGGGLLVHRPRAGFAAWDPETDRWRDAAPGRWLLFGPPVVSRDGRTFAAPVGLPVPAWQGPRSQTRVAVYETATLAERDLLPAPPPAAAGDSWWAAAFAPDGRGLAYALGPDVRVFDLTDAADDGPGAPAPPRPADLWAALAGAAAPAGAAVRRLGNDPDLALALFREKLSPAADAGPDPAAVAKLVAALDAPAFADREAAGKALRAHLRRAEPHLRAAHAATGSAEQKARLAALLAAADRLTPDELRHVRAVEVLERVGTPAAADLLKRLAGGAADAVLTREARATLARLPR